MEKLNIQQDRSSTDPFFKQNSGVEAVNNNLLDQLPSKDFLRQKDVEILSTGMAKLKDFFTGLPDSKMPSVIIFFDTSARPLCYLLKPLIEQTYTQRGLRLPKIQFAVSYSEIEKWTSDAHEFEYFEEELGRLNAEQRGNPGLDLQPEIEVIKDIMETKQEAELEMKLGIRSSLSIGALEHEKYTVMPSRISKIIDSSDNKEVLFVDDYINKGGTIENLDSSLSTIIDEVPSLADIRVNLFCFYRNNKSLEYEKDHPESRVTIINGLSGGDDYQGFLYRDVSAFSPLKKGRYQKDKEAMIGVKKEIGKETVVRAPNADHERMALLRKTMRELGERILHEEISPVNSDKL